MNITAPGISIPNVSPFQPRVANANHAPTGSDGADTSERGLVLLNRIAYG
ncbi:MAG: hypothetical protein WBB25_01705 [Sulfitobacter sp.]